MGVMGTIVGFGAGYALGANRSAAPIKRAEGKVRDAVAQRLPAAEIHRDAGITTGT